MRNLFDQYDQPENRLSHALAVCLNEDRSLLREFMRWIGVAPPVAATRLLIVEQTLPGDRPESEEEADRRGLPDIVIHDGEEWCLLVESKVQAALTEDQLRRHERTLRRRGFRHITRLVLTTADATVRRSVALTWAGIYEWLGTARAQSAWGDRLRSYLRAAEVRLTREAYLTEGTLTMFDGFQFSAENPYTYGEAKRLLKLAMAELRKDRRLKALGMDSVASGRTAITGKGGSAVWDFLPLTDRPKRVAFTAYPHLTLAVHTDHLEVAITIPNGVMPSVRRRLIDLEVDGLVRMNADIMARTRRLRTLGASVQAYAVQRHYVSQRSAATIDARLTFKLDTSHPRRQGRVRRQPEWVALFAELLQRKRSNIQFGYVVSLPWGLKGLDRRDSLKLITGGWIGMKPLLDIIRGAHRAGPGNAWRSE